MTEKEREEFWQDMRRRSREAREKLREFNEELRAGKIKPSDLKPVTPEMEEHLRNVYKDRPMD